MEKKVPETNEKKPWVKPQLVVYGNIEKLTTEAPMPIVNPPRMSGS